MERSNFSFKKSWYDLLTNMSHDVQCKIYIAVVDYAFKGEIPNLEGMEQGVFSFIKNEIDAEYEKQLELANKRREWGRQGGAPKGNRNASKTTINKQNKHKVVLPQKEQETTTPKVIDKEDISDKNKQNKVKVVFDEKSPIKTEKKEESKNEKERTKEKEKIKEEIKEKNNTYIRAHEAPLLFEVSPTPPTNPRYKKFQVWLTSNAPYITKHFTNTITEKEFEKLLEQYSAEEISEVIAEIENRVDLRKTYTNLYRTSLNWLKNRSNNLKRRR